MNSELEALLNAIQTDLQEMLENHIYEFKCGRVSCVTLLFGRYLLHKLKKTYYVLPSVIPYHSRSWLDDLSATSPTQSVDAISPHFPS